MNNLMVAGSCNIRDLGGYQTKDGHSTRRKVFIRSGGLDKVTAEGCQFVRDYGIKTIIDVRDEWEAKDFPNVFAQASDMHYINLPLIGNRLSQDEDWKAASEKYSYLYELYAYYLEQCQPQIATIIGAAAAGTGGTIIQCYAGKDRTGLIAALILGAVGVSTDDIVDDYAESGLQIAHLVAERRLYAVENGRNMQNFERDMASEPETMANTLNYLNERYGGVQDYLMRCGVTDSQLTELRRRFVEAD